MASHIEIIAKPDAFSGGASVSVGDGDIALPQASEFICEFNLLRAGGEAASHQSTVAGHSTDASADAYASARTAALSASATSPRTETAFDNAWSPKVNKSAHATATKAASSAATKHKASPSGKALVSLSVDGESCDSKAKELCSGMLTDTSGHNEHQCFLKALLIMRVCYKGVEPLVAAVMDALRKKIINDVQEKIRLEFPCMSDDDRKLEWDCSTCVEAEKVNFDENGHLRLHVSACVGLNGVGLKNGVVKTEKPHCLKPNVLHHGSKFGQQLLMYVRPDQDKSHAAPETPLLNAASSHSDVSGDDLSDASHLSKLPGVVPDPSKPDNSKEILLLNAVSPMVTKPQLIPFSVKLHNLHDPAKPPRQFHAVLCDGEPGQIGKMVHTAAEKAQVLQAGSNTPEPVSSDVALKFWSLKVNDKVNDISIVKPYLEAQHPLKDGDIVSFHGSRLPSTIANDLHYVVIARQKFSFGVCGPIIDTCIPCPFSFDIVRRSPICRFRDAAFEYLEKTQKNDQHKDKVMNVHWAGINAHELSNQLGEFCKLFCGQSSKDLNLFKDSDSIRSGEQFFNLIQFCKAFRSEILGELLNKAPTSELRTQRQASLNDALCVLKESAIALRKFRNTNIGHGDLNCVQSNDFECMRRNAHKFLAAVKQIAEIVAIPLIAQRAENSICEACKIEMTAERELEAKILMAELRFKPLRSNHSLVTQNGSFFHAFICQYSADDDDVAKGNAAKQLFDILHEHAMNMPLHDGFSWPEGFSVDLPERKTSGVRLFLDNQSFKKDVSSESRHLDALLKSIVFVPVFSSKSLKQMSDISQQSVDKFKFWLELILARELHEMAKRSRDHSYPCSLVFPVFDQGQIPKFDANPLKKLNKKARLTLEQAGLSMTHELESNSLSPQMIINYYWNNFSIIHMDSMDTVSKKTACVLVEGVQNAILSVHEQNTAYNFPQGIELNEFLSEAAMSRYAPILARHYIHSVSQLSTLDLTPICAVSVAKEAAKASALTLEVESMMLMGVIMNAKKSSLSQNIGTKFKNYIDEDASILTAAFSASALDIFYSKRTAIFAVFVSGVAIMMQRIPSFVRDDETSLCGPENLIPDAPSYHLAGSFSQGNLALGLITSSLVSIRFPKWAKLILAFCFGVQSLFDVIHGQIVYDALVYRHCPFNTTRYASECCLMTGSQNTLDFFEQNLSMYNFRTYRSATHACWIVLWMSLCLCCLIKQSFVFPVFLIGIPVLLGTKDIFALFVDASYANFDWLFSGLSGFYIPLIILKGFQRYGRHLSSTIANQEAEYLNLKYDQALGESRVSLTPFVTLNPNAPVLQHHSDLSGLYAQHEFINGPFQTWIGSFLANGPQLKWQSVSRLFDSPCPESISEIYRVEAKPTGTFVIAPIKEVHRAISKIYRAYGGNVCRITDIVRCSVVLNTMEDINVFLEMLKNVAWIDAKDFQEAIKQVAIGENPLQSTHWFSWTRLEKLKLLLMFLLSFFRLRVLGIPPDTNHHHHQHTNYDPLVERKGAFQILRVRNRFAEKSPVGGYRDINIKVKIGFKCSPILHAPIFLPVENWQKKGVQTVVCEIQVHLRDLHDAIKNNPSVHSNYVKSRNLQSM